MDSDSFLALLPRIASNAPSLCEIVIFQESHVTKSKLDTLLANPGEKLLSACRNMAPLQKLTVSLNGKWRSSY